MALTISLTLEFSDPVHWYEQPSSLHASSAPYLVGTKNGLVVTWLTSVNFSFPSPSPNTPVAGVPLWAEAFLSLSPPPHAFSANAARPAAPPVSAERRVTALQRCTTFGSSRSSVYSRRSITSSTAPLSGTWSPPGFLGHPGGGRPTRARR